MWTFTLKGLWSRKRRLAGTSLAIVLGVAFLAATLILGDTMRRGFGGLYAEANAGTDVIVRSSAVIDIDDDVQRGLVDEALVEQLSALDGVATAVPTIEGTGQIVGSNGRPIGGQGPPTIAANWIEDGRLNPYRIAEGRPPLAPDEVVIDRASAEHGNLHVGDRTTVLTPAPTPVTIVGVATFGSLDSFGASTYAGFTTDAAQQLLVGESGKVSAIRIVAEPNVEGAELRARVEAVLPPGFEALTGAELSAEQKQDLESSFLGVAEAFLIAFAGVALLVATCSIHNTFTILAAQRTRESALLRAVGASRRQVLTSMAVEALTVGALASGAGLGAGVGIALGLKELLASMGLETAASGVTIAGSAVVTSLLVGVGVTLIASVVPALRASRVAPIAALRDVAVDRSGVSRLRAALGLVVAGGGAALTVLATASPDGALARAGIGSLLAVAGLVILGPVLARPAVAVLGIPAAVLRGSTGRLARRNAMRNPRRTSGSASALMVGTAVVVLFATVGASIKASIDDTVERTFGGDLVMVQDRFSGAAISPEVADAVRQLPEVAHSAALAEAIVTIDGADALPNVIEPAEFAPVLDLDDVAGSVGAMQAGELAVSEKYAADHDLHLGSALRVGFADGAASELTVTAIYRVRDIVGDVLMTRADWEPHAVQSGDVAVLIDLAKGVDLVDGRAAVQRVADQYSAPDVQDRDEYVASVAGEIDQMLTLVYGMLGLAVLIALMGIANTLSLSMHERTRELGLLRAIGQSRRQLRATIRWEAVIVAVFGTVCGAALGTFLGWGLVRAVATQEGFGSFTAPIPAIGVILGMAVVAGVVAAMRPARRGARLDVLSAIATD